MFRQLRLLTAALLACLFAVSVLQAVPSFSPEDEARLRATGSCAGCDLVEADLRGLTAELGDLSGANLTNANLYMVNLRGADLTGANLNGADLSSAQLQNARGANLAGAITDSRTQCPNSQAGPCS